MPIIDSYIGAANLLREDLGRIARQLEEAAEQVDQARRQPQDLAAQLKQLNGNIENIESEITAEVATETIDEVGVKLKYTNDTARKGEVARRSQKHPDLIAMRREKNILEMQKLDADVRLQGASDALKAYSTVSALKNAEVELLATTISALSTRYASDDMMNEIERVIAGRLSASLKDGKMRAELKGLIRAELDLDRERTIPR